MRMFKIAVWVLIALMSGFLAWGYFGGDPIRKTVQQVADIGGPFDLVRADGSRITEKDLQGKPHVIFFGFTHCPEICPTTLFEASGWLKELGEDADKIAVYFFSVDPERDTQEVLAEYMTSFDPRIVAITGPAENMEKAIKAYRVFARKVPLDEGGYTVDHTASVYLMHGNGNFSGTISWGEDKDIALEKLRNLIKKG